MHREKIPRFPDVNRETASVIPGTATPEPRGGSRAAKTLRWDFSARLVGRIGRAPQDRQAGEQEQQDHRHAEAR